MAAMAPRVYVDFNTMAKDSERRVHINTRVQQDIISLLRPGLPVILYDETLEVEAIAEFDEQCKEWVGRPDWSPRRDLPYP